MNKKNGFTLRTMVPALLVLAMILAACAPAPTETAAPATEPSAADRSSRHGTFGSYRGPD